MAVKRIVIWDLGNCTGEYELVDAEKKAWYSYRGVALSALRQSRLLLVKKRVGPEGLNETLKPMTPLEAVLRRAGGQISRMST